MKLRQYYIYILSNKRNNVLYIGVTSDLINRLGQHRLDNPTAFTSKYNLHKLLYYEIFDSAEAAISREKQLKRWHRDWKFNLIKQLNPELEDLTPHW